MLWYVSRAKGRTGEPCRTNPCPTVTQSDGSVLVWKGPYRPYPPSSL